MSVAEHSVERAVTPSALRTSTRRRRRGGGATWWRHVVAIIAIAFALFPILYIVSSSLNADQTLSASSLLPRKVTFDNYRDILSGELVSPGNNVLPIPFLRWYANSMIVGLIAAFSTVLLGALAAYAFSRFRFKGRRIGMLTLLLIQMFPQFLALVAIYLILDATGSIFSFIGLNTLSGLLLVYLAGAMGVNAWLMKGFFDTIPSELDESARVDGATPAQVFWGVVLPLAAPVLAVVALLAFIGTLNEFVIASALLQTQDNFTLPVGMQFLVSQKYNEQWGPFTAGVVLAAIPVVILFAFLQRFIVHGLTGGAVKG
ncbi:MAG TPA: sugar ABC transporter permease [Thermoanaerobaculia bacterium]|nr:sugar ABC transporter permease [Thermoanaerobaculia bacterium]